MEMGDRLREIREKMGLSVDAMAKKVGMKNRKSWEGYEKGANSPKADVLTILTEEGFNPYWILTGNGSIRGNENGTNSNYQEKGIYTDLSPGNKKSNYEEKWKEEEVRECLRNTMSAVIEFQNKKGLRYDPKITPEFILSVFDVVKKDLENARQEDRKLTSEEVRARVLALFILHTK